MYRDESRRDVESDQTDAMMAMGRWVRRRRESLGITQEELAAAIDASQRYISRLELGHSASLPSRLWMRRLARALNCTTDDLLAAAGYVDDDAAPAEVELESDEAIFTSLMRGVNRLGISDNDKRAIQITIDLVRRLSDMQREDEA